MGTYYLMDKLIRFFSSLKLAVILLIGFVILLSIATFYESYTSTEAAQQLIYQRFWFDALLFLLALNVIGSAMIRYPWKKQHVGFVITHAGILIILFGSIVTRKYGIEGQIAIQEGEQISSISVETPSISFQVPSQKIQVDYEPWFMSKPIPQGKEVKYAIGNSSITCYINRYFQNPQMIENVNNEAQESNPAILITLLSATNSASQYQQWLVANNPERRRLELMAGAITFHAAQIPDASDSVSEGNQLDIYSTTGQEFTFKSRSAGGKIMSGTITVGEEIDTGWKGILFRIDKFYDKAKLTETIVEGNEDSTGHNSPVIHLRLEKNTDKTEANVIYNTPKVLTLGSEQCVVHFGQKQIPMGFTLQLLDFRAPHYPGTNRPSSFESDVKMIDPVKQIEHKQRIYMNNPLYYNGYIVYQSSYVEGKNGQPDVSIFSVSRAPGTPIIYAGSIIMILGMIIVVILKSKTQIPIANGSSTNQ